MSRSNVRDRMAGCAQVFHAKAFRQLRRLLHGMDDVGEHFFIRSLSRCAKWDPHGGKSKADFCKMLDDRFILKQVCACGRGCACVSVCICICVMYIYTNTFRANVTTPFHDAYQYIHTLRVQTLTLRDTVSWV